MAAGLNPIPLKGREVPDGVYHARNQTIRRATTTLQARPA
jgi:hypothetical protein